MSPSAIVVFSGLSWLAIAGLRKKGPLRLLIEWLTILRALWYALQDFLYSGAERMAQRWPEYLERAKKEV